MRGFTQKPMLAKLRLIALRKLGGIKTTAFYRRPSITPRLSVYDHHYSAQTTVLLSWTRRVTQTSYRRVSLQSTPYLQAFPLLSVVTSVVNPRPLSTSTSTTDTSYSASPSVKGAQYADNTDKQSFWIGLKIIFILLIKEEKIV